MKVESTIGRLSPGAQANIAGLSTHHFKDFVLLVRACSFSNSRSVFPGDAGNHDTFPAIPWQGWAVRISASGGKGAFPASDRCRHSGKNHNQGFTAGSQKTGCASRHLLSSPRQHRHGGLAATLASPLGQAQGAPVAVPIGNLRNMNTAPAVG